MGIVKDIKNLIIGLGITGKHLGRHAITIQYPEQRDDIPERSRGIVVLLSDKKTGELNCTACELCMRACPTAAITIKQHRDENKKKVLDSFVIDNTLCCFCGLCEEACNFCALKMANMYEFSTTNKDDLVWDVTKLQEMGRDVPYEDTRKKKKPKPAPKPAEPKADAAVVESNKPEEPKEPKEPEKPAEAIDSDIEKSKPSAPPDNAAPPEVKPESDNDAGEANNADNAKKEGDE